MAYLEVITGPMFSGKSEELIRLLRRERIAKKKILVIKPAGDTRTAQEVAARTKDMESDIFKKSASFPAQPVGSKDEVLELLNAEAYDVLGVDEAQFFDYWLLDLIKELKLDGTKADLRIIVTGLDLDAWGRTFGTMGDLMALANSVQKLTAICFVCGKDAMYTQKIGGSKKQIEVGDTDIYEARCERCFEPVGLIPNPK